MLKYLRPIEEFIIRNIAFNRYLILISGILIFVPVVVSAAFYYNGILVSFLQLMYLFFFFILQFAIIALINLLRSNRLIKRMAISVFSMFYLLLYIIIISDIIHNRKLSYVMIFFNLPVTISSFSKVYGLPITFFIGLVFVMVFFVFYFVIGKEMWDARIESKFNVFTTLVILLAFIVMISVYTDNINFVKKTSALISRFGFEEDSFLSVYDNATYKTDSRTNVIILHLESINSIAVQGNFSVEGRIYTDNFTPNLWKASSGGIFMPRFYGNSVRTINAQANILCSVFFNINKPFAYSPGDVKHCLPELLNASGYKTLFFRADVLDYTNIRNFMTSIGFEELHREDIMKPEDVSYSWGYPDRVFYERVFDFLDRGYRGGQGLFAYIEVSAHHYPFTDYRKDSSFSPPLPGLNFYEDYLNSLAWQDKSFRYFMERFNHFRTKDTILFVTGDHSWPLYEDQHSYNSLNAMEDNFVTSALWFLPEGTGKRLGLRFSETDIKATIFGLLNDEVYKNSFAFALKDGLGADYEDCHVMIQPYGKLLVNIVRNRTKIQYDHEDRTVVSYDLDKDIFEKDPKLIMKDADYNDFLKMYLCDRYRGFLNPKILKEKKANFHKPLIIVFELVIFLIYLDYLFMVRRYQHLKQLNLHKPTLVKESELKEKIDGLRKKGHSEKWIKDSLEMAGWSKMRIRKHLRREDARKNNNP